MRPEPRRPCVGASRVALGSGLHRPTRLGVLRALELYWPSLLEPLRADHVAACVGVPDTQLGRQ